MPRRKQATVGSWFSNQLWNTSLPWLGIVAFGIVGFYFLTNAKLDAHDRALTEINTRMEKQWTAVSDAKKSDAAEREKSRNEFLTESTAAAAGIAELNKQTAVMATTLMGVEKALDKIGQKLEAAGRR